MKSYGSGKALHALAMYALLGLAWFLISFGTVLADDQSKPSTPAEADRQIASLLENIEGALARSETIPSETTQMLISAGGLLPSASPEGLRLLKGFPARLRKDADEAGDPRERKYLAVFANAAAGYIDTVTLNVSGQSPASAPPASVKQESKVAALAQPDLSDPPRLAPIVQRTLLSRGDAMLGLGNVSAARMLYQRAADAGVGVAARKLAETYDPAFLTAHDLRGIKPDPVAAGAWYRRAEALGDAEAIERLRSQQGRTLADSLATH
jgi:TPR repeat protein